MGIETKIKYLGVPQTKILEFSFSTGGHFEKWPKRAVCPSFFFCQHREYHSWESTEENDTTHGGSWGGGGCMGTPFGLWTNTYTYRSPAEKFVVHIKIYRMSEGDIPHSHYVRLQPPLLTGKMHPE